MQIGISRGLANCVNVRSKLVAPGHRSRLQKTNSCDEISNQTISFYKERQLYRRIFCTHSCQIFSAGQPSKCHQKTPSSKGYLVFISLLYDRVEFKWWLTPSELGKKRRKKNFWNVTYSVACIGCVLSKCNALVSPFIISDFCRLTFFSLRHANE